MSCASGRAELPVGCGDSLDRDMLSFIWMFDQKTRHATERILAETVPNLQVEHLNGARGGIEDGHLVRFDAPQLVSFDQALTFIRRVRSDKDTRIYSRRASQPAVVLEGGEIDTGRRVARSIRTG